MPDPTGKTISSSELPAILGCSPWSTRWLVAQRFLGQELPDRSSNFMDWGVQLQPLILAQAGRDLAIEVDANVEDAYIQRGMFGYTADGWSHKPDVGRGVIECKCVFNFRSWMSKEDDGWDGGKKLPRYVEIQTQEQMMVGDGEKPFEWGIVAAWHDAELHYFNLTPNLDAWAAFSVAGVAFLDDIAAGNPGEPFGDPSELPMIQRLFAPQPGKVLDLRNDPRGNAVAHQVTQFEWHKREQRGHEKGVEAAKGALLALILDNEELLLPFGITVKSKRVQRKGFTVQPTEYNRLTARVPDELVQQHLDPTEDAAESEPVNILAGG